MKPTARVHQHSAPSITMADIDMPPVLDRHAVYLRTYTLGKWVRELWKWSDEDSDMYHCRHTGDTGCECWKCISCEFRRAPPNCRIGN